MTKAIKKNEKKLPISPIKLFNLLNSNNVNFELYKHVPLYSVSESKVVQENIFPSDTQKTCFRSTGGRLSKS